MRIGIAFAFVLTFASSAWAQLSGTKTVGGTSPNYPNLVAAVAALNAEGVGGAGVTFDIRGGTYAGQLVITATGTEASPIVFRRISGTVTVTAPSTVDTVIYLQGADWVTLQNLTVNGGAQNAVKMDSGAVHNTVKRCVLKVNTTAAVSRSAVVGDGTVEEAVLDGNDIQITASNLSANVKGVEMPSCTVQNCKIKGSGAGADDGIYIFDGTGATAQIFNNRVFNFDYRAIHINGGNAECSFNTLYGSSSAGTDLLASHGSGGTTTWRNNLFSNESTNPGHYCFYVSDGFGSVESNFNLFYYPNGANAGYWDGVRTALYDWQDGSGQDADSRAGNPRFVNTNDFRLQNASPAQGRGTPLESVTTDFEGNARNAATPDVGADENAAAGPAGPMAGTVSVGAGLTYTNLQSAVTDLVTRGVNASLTVEVASGTYGAVTFDTIPGCGPANPVTISGMAATISAAGGTAALRLVGADHLTIQGLTVTATNRNGILLPAGSRSVTLTLNTIQVTRTSGSSIACVRSFGATQDELVVSQNTLAIAVNGGSGECWGVKNAGVMTISGNLIMVTASASGNHKGVITSNTVTVEGNRIVGSGTNAKDGLYLDGTVGGPAQVRNNMVYGFQYRQMYVLGAANCFFNTAAGNGNRIVEVANGSNTVWRNNIFFNLGTSSSAFCFYRSGGTVDGDYNDFYRPNGARTGYWGSARATLANWQAASAQDANSIAANPLFTADYHLTEESPCRNVGLELPDVAVDFDGDSRTAPVDLGADEVP